MQQLRRFLVPIILLFVLFLAILLFAVTLLRPRATTGDAANAGAASNSGGLFSNLFPQAAGPVQPTAAPAAAQVAAPAAAPQPAAAAPAAQATPMPTAIPVPTAVVVMQLTPVPAVNTNGNVINGNAATTSTSSNNSGSVDTNNEAGGVQCGTRVIHTVRAGENLFRIGLRYNTTATAIARLNRITNVRNVSVGRRLVVVACARGGGSGAYFASRSGMYAVRAGDTLFSIASRFGVNVQYLCRVNGLYTSLIVPGQTLVIP